MMTFAEAMAFIGSFSRGGTPVRDLSRIGGLMQKLGNPQDSLQFLHIAGTNGKGSVAEYLTGILTEAGYRTGTFTSPFIRHYRDRIRLNGSDIPEAAVCSACEILRKCASPEEGYSQFEITFAVAMLYFTWVDAELVVLETGVGGLLDCTNIVKNTLVCIFTKIGLDHMAVLGNTVAEIARQKAGIYKPGASIVCSPDCGDELYQILSGIAGTADTGSSLHQPSAAPEKYVLLECDAHHTMFYDCGRVYRTGMGFAYQTNNARTAIEAARALNRHAFTVSEEAIQRGLAKTCLPGRMQVLSENPLILLDGAHNRDGIRMLADTIKTSGFCPVFGIIGMTHADAAPFAAVALGERFDQVLCVDGFAPNAMPSNTLRGLFAGTMKNAAAETAPLHEALDIAKEWSHSQKPHPAIVICGSLYLASWYLNKE